VKLDAGIVDSHNDAKHTDVSGVEWKEIVLTRDQFERLNKMNVHEVQDVDEVQYYLYFLRPMLPLCFFVLYGILIFKSEVSEVTQSILKFSLFILTVFYITNDETLKNMGVNFTSRILIGFCFAGLLVAASSVV